MNSQEESNNSTPSSNSLNEEQPDYSQKQLMYYAKEKQVQKQVTIDPFLTAVTQLHQTAAPTASTNNENKKSHSEEEKELEDAVMHRYNALPNRIIPPSVQTTSHLEFDEYDEEEQQYQIRAHNTVAGSPSALPLFRVQDLMNQFTVSVTGIILVLFFYFAVFPSHRHPPLTLVIVAAVMFFLAMSGQILQNRVFLGTYLLMAAVVEGYVTTILLLNGFEVESLVGASGVLLFFSLLNGAKLFLKLQRRMRMQDEY